MPSLCFPGRIGSKHIAKDTWFHMPNVAGSLTHNKTTECARIRPRHVASEPDGETHRPHVPMPKTQPSGGTNPVTKSPLYRSVPAKLRRSQEGGSLWHASPPALLGDQDPVLQFFSLTGYDSFNFIAGFHSRSCILFQDFIMQITFSSS